MLIFVSISIILRRWRYILISMWKRTISVRHWLCLGWNKLSVTQHLWMTFGQLSSIAVSVPLTLTHRQLYLNKPRVQRIFTLALRILQFPLINIRFSIRLILLVPAPWTPSLTSSWSMRRDRSLVVRVLLLILHLNQRVVVFEVY